jgi:hypothetical protein
MREITNVLFTTYDDRKDYFLSNTIWCDVLCLREQSIFLLKDALDCELKLQFIMFTFASSPSLIIPPPPSLTPFLPYHLALCFLKFYYEVKMARVTRPSLRVFFLIFFRIFRIEPKWLSSLERYKKKWQSSLGRFSYKLDMKLSKCVIFPSTHSGKQIQKYMMIFILFLAPF